jgi:NADPH:quinone reductase
MTMLAAFYERCGASHEVLAVGEIPRPEPGPGEVLVRLRLSGVNPTDWKARAKYQTEFAFQVPNQDGVGVVEAVGEGVEESRVGERVWVYFAAWRRQWGTAAQWTVVPAEQAVPLPDGASDELGASLGIPALTAHRCLFADGPVAGLTVLVAGGAGAVGHAAIELARWGGARVIATASTDEKAALARAAGADTVVDYRREDAASVIRAAAPEGVDRIVEVSPARNLELDLAVCAPGATIGAYATDGGTEAPLPFWPLMHMNTTLRFVLVYTMPSPALHQAISEVGHAVREGALSALPIHRYALDRIADAHDAVEHGAVGKVVVDIP